MQFHKSRSALFLIAILSVAGSGYAQSNQSGHEEVMLILRGVSSSENPQGQLDDQSALEYAHRVGFRGEVLDVPGDTGSENAQVCQALERIRRETSITALYGFSGGGYNARLIWAALNGPERNRIRKVVIVGSPGLEASNFAGSPEVIIKSDPPEGHLAGPKSLLESLGSDRSEGKRN
jgi:pimeloyl-ACP methyl ester carboxylesterase